jgi:Tfp pilus assembly protein PilF
LPTLSDVSQAAADTLYPERSRVFENLGLRASSGSAIWPAQLEKPCA